MDVAAMTGLALVLSCPGVVGDGFALAEGWADQDIVLRLGGIGHLAPPDLGAHLRRSFLGALGPGGSGPARAGRPCPWDPPCALDVFCREQLRTGGDGLPKPYVLALQAEGRDLLVTLRIFGMANDWAMTAAEALVAGVTGILPWGRVIPGLAERPPVTGRQILPGSLMPQPAPGPLRIRFASPADMSGDNPGGPADPAARLLSRMIRRVDAMARWQGLALSPIARRDLTLAAHGLRGTASLTPGRHVSPNRKGQRRDDPVATGWIDLPHLPEPLWPILAISARCHVGRHATEGLGALQIGGA
jgi:hypothetical protein